MSVVETKNEEEEGVASEENLVQAVQTAAGFAEPVVKRLWAHILKKNIDDLFDDIDDMPDNVGAITLDAVAGSGQSSYSLKLDIVDCKERQDMLQFKDIPYIFDEMSRILAAAELYWKYSKKTYNLPELDLWRSDWGTLFVAGAPPTMNHIGIRIIHR